MKDEKLDRRDFFKKAAAIGAAVTGAGTLLAACDKGGGGEKTGGGSEKTGGEKTGGGSEKTGGGQAGGEKAGGELSCEDTSGLKKSEIKVRKSLKYTDDSPKEGQLCDNCQYWQPAEKEGACGGCQIVPGPIHPKGWCTSWMEAKG